MHAVDLAARLRVKRFLYVSTAYSCGTKTGAIDETLHSSAGSFNNPYEESKAEAEQRVVAACAEHGIACTVLRPSIVIGPRATMQPGGTQTGLYGFLREIDKLRIPLSAAHGSVRVHADPDAELNFIPVDDVMRDICHLITTDFAGSPIRHLTASEGVRVARVVAMMSEELGCPNLEVSSDESDPSPVERLIARRTDFYSSYMKARKRFVRSLPSRHVVTDDACRAFVREGVRELRAPASRDALFRSRTIESWDGTPLTTFEAGTPDAITCVILVNAYGMPVDFWGPLAERLAPVARVITWETRGVPGFAPEAESLAVDLDAHVRDLAAVAEAYGALRVALVGWCTGAMVALKAAAEYADRVERLVLLNGVYNLEGTPDTSFTRSMRVVMPAVASSRKRAEFYHRALFARSGATATDDEARASEQTNSILASTDPELVGLASIPFRSVESLYQYGRLISAFLDDRGDAYAASIAVPAAVVTGGADVTAPPEASHAIERLLPRAELWSEEHWDHFSFYRDPELSVRLHDWLLATVPHEAAAVSKPPRARSRVTGTVADA